MVILFFTLPAIIILIEISRVYLLYKKIDKAKRILSKRENELNYLNFLTASMIEKKSIQESFPVFLNRLKEIVGWTYHSIFRLDEKRQVLIARFTGYLPDWYIEQFSNKVLIRVGDASVGRAVATKQPAAINKVDVDPRFKSVSSITKDIEYHSLTCCPIIGRLKNYGGFCTYSMYENIFTLHDTQFLLTCSNMFATYLEITMLQAYEPQSKLDTIS